MFFFISTEASNKKACSFPQALRQIPTVLFFPLLHGDSPPSYLFFQFPDFRRVSESSRLESNWQNYQKHRGTADSVIRSHNLVLQMVTHLQLPLKNTGRSKIPILLCHLTPTVIYVMLSIAHPWYCQDFCFRDFCFSKTRRYEQRQCFYSF